MPDPTTSNLGLFTPANGADSGAWDIPVNANWQSIDNAFGGNITINVVGASGTNTLALSQYQNRILIFSGTLTANVAYQFPSGIGGTWNIVNATSGAFSLVISSGGGGISVTCGQGFNTLVFSDGANVLLSQNAPQAAPGANNQVIVNSSGAFGASSALTFDGTTLAAPAFSGAFSGTVGSNPIGYRNIPPSARADADSTSVGEYLSVSTGTTINPGIFSAGDAFLIVNTIGSPVTIAQASGVALHQSGTTNTGNRTLAAYGTATVLCVGSNTFYISGAGLS